MGLPLRAIGKIVLYKVMYFEINLGILEQGVYKWKDGRVYSGFWKDSFMDGRGKYEWPNGRIYEGEYKKDKKEGFGIYVKKLKI